MSYILYLMHFMLGLVIPSLLPLAYIYFWREKIQRKGFFFLISLLSSFGISIATSMVDRFLLEPLLRAVWHVPQLERLGENHPSSDYIVLAFNLLLYLGLLIAVMNSQRRALTVKTIASPSQPTP